MLIQNSAATVTLEDIAAAAGVSPRTFFNHFETRGDLMSAIAHDRAAFVAAAVDAYEGTRPSGLLRSLGQQTVDYARQSGPHYREFVANLTRHSATDDIVRTGVLGDALHAFAARAVSSRNGEGKASAVTAAVLGDLLAGSLIVAIANFAADPAFDFAEALKDAGRSLDTMVA